MFKQEFSSRLEQTDLTFQLTHITFNHGACSLHLGLEQLKDRTTKSSTNEDIPSIHSSPSETTFDIAGPITSRAKQLEKEIHSQVNANLMLNNQIMLNGPMLLSTCFNVLRNDGVHEQAWDDDGFCPPNICMEPGRA